MSLPSDVEARKRSPSAILDTAVLLTSAIAVFALLLYRFFADALGHDQISYLMEAQRFVAGDILYGPHIAETNPPLIIWFSAIPVLLGNWFHGSPVLFLRLMVMAMILASTAWCLRILLHNTVLSSLREAGLLGCSILAIEFGMGPYEFGQREHLLVILVFPYVVAVATRVTLRLSFAERCAIGIAAGTAIWFKPQDVIVLLVLEFFLAIRARSLRRVVAPEVVSLALTSGLILVLVRAVAPLYFTSTIPLLLDLYWGLGTASALQLALSLHVYMLIVFMLLAGCLLLKKLRDRTTTLALVLCSLAASIAYDMQHTEWKYHVYPQWAFLLLAVGYLLVDWSGPFLERFAARTFSLRQSALAAAGVTVVLLCAAAIRPHIVIPSPRPAWDPELDRYLAQYPPSTTVSVLSPSVAPMASAFNHGLNWGSRFAHLWMMPALIQDELGPKSASAPFKRLPPERLTTLDNLQRTETADDLNYWRPSIVLVQRCTVSQPCEGIGRKDFNMLAWFQRSLGFDQAWLPYRKEPGLRHFDVYKRNP